MTTPELIRTILDCAVSGDLTKAEAALNKYIADKILDAAICAGQVDIGKVIINNLNNA